MISNTFQTNTFVEGMDCDTDITMLPNQRYRYAENVRVITNDEGTTGVLQNIEGVKKYSTVIPSDETIVGVTTIDKYAVVITSKNNGYNKIYRIDNIDSDSLSATVVLKGNIGLCSDIIRNPRISVVANYESDNLIKIYFTDGNSAVKVFNIMDDSYTDATSGLIDNNGDIIDTGALDITPSAVLPPFQTIGLGMGSLPSGMVQYCYQLFNLNTSETTTSPLSELIHLTASSTNQDSQVYEGSFPDTSSNKSVMLSTDLVAKSFSRCRIIRILYTSNNSIPTFTILDEIVISNTSSKLNYTDTGNSYLSDLTVDEFNSLTGYQFIGCSLAKLQNRLFVANITDSTWDPGDYDARAYRANDMGKVLLQSSNELNNIQFDIDSYDLSSIPKDHDCINPYNNLEYCSCTQDEKYMYGASVDGNRKLGGHGLNIDYSFITTDLRLFQDANAPDADTYVLNDCSMNKAPENITSLNMQEIGSDTVEQVELKDTSTESRQPNYADPYIAANFKGYQRDEIYRFGIIFYNNKSLPSPVYWIGDIKMPHAVQSSPFEYADGTLTGKALGIRFTVRNIPDGAVAYEIVRCDRTEDDRHVVMQVAASNLYEYKIQENGTAIGEGSALDSSVEARPIPFFTNIIADFSTTSLVRIEKDWVEEVTRRIYSSDMAKDYVRFVSPEICIQKQDIEQYLKDGSYIDIVGLYRSPVYGQDEYLGAFAFCTAKITQNPYGTVNDWGPKLSYIRIKDEILDFYSYNMEWVGTRTMDYGWSVMIAKYFYHNEIDPTTYKDGATVIIKDAKYATDIPYNAGNNVGPYKISIGSRTYTNWAMSNFREPGAQNLTGPAGPSLIVYAEGYHNIFPGINSNPSDVNRVTNLNAIMIHNVKRNTINAYGGNTYGSRQNSVYISTNSYVSVENESVTTDTYGGDTFLGLLDYPNMFTFQLNDADQWNWCKAFVGSYIPFETSINTNLLNGDMIHKTYSYGDSMDPHLQLEPTQIQNFHSQDRPYYSYNSVYSSQRGAKQFVPKSIYSESNIHNSNRIMVSQAKVNNEISDSWTMFKAADYIDVDNQYGSITNLKTFKDKLFYFQDSAVGIASVNDRSLITDDNSNQLVLGTGGILSRFDYITTANGSSIANDKSITNSDNVLYWYDYDKNEICAYDGRVNIISKEKNVQSYLNDTINNRDDDNLSFYDKKYNEVWFNINNKPIIFNEQIGRFTSFYTFDPNWALSFSDKLITIKDNQYYIINSDNTSNLIELDKTSKIELVVNKDVMYTKVFDNISIAGSLKDKSDNNLTKDLIDKIVFDTKHQVATSINPTFDYRENTYRLPIPRQDTNNEDSLSYPARMRGKTMICDYQLDTNNGNTFKIPFITTTYRYSLI